MAQGRADWGVEIENVAAGAGLGFLALQEEQFDFVVPRVRLPRAAVQAFCKLLQRADTRRALQDLGFQPAKED